MRTDKLEALLNLSFIIGFAFVLSTFSPITASEASASLEGMPVLTQYSRNASDAYEMDEYEVCTLVHKLPDSECDKLIEEVN
jgi:hypothetical protein